MPHPPAMDDTTRLHTVMFDAAVRLSGAVGSAREVGFDAPRSRGIVDRDRVPEAAWRAAVCALDFLMVAVGILEGATEDPDEDVDDGLRRILDPRDGEPAT